MTREDSHLSRRCSLAENYLESEAGVAVATALATTSSIEAIDLSTNEFEPAVGVALGAALASNSALKQVNVSDNDQLGAEGVLPIVAALASANCTLTSLVLDCVFDLQNDFEKGEDVLDALEAGLKASATLKTLS